MPRQILFVDESGTHDATHCLIAGYIGAPLQWAKFDVAWQSALTKHGVVGAFHAYELWNHNRWTRAEPNEFAGWTSEREARLTLDLLNVIRDFRVNPIGASVEIAAFDALTFGERSLLALHTSKRSRRIRIDQPRPYYLAFSCVLSAADKHVRSGTTIDMVLAKHQQVGKRAEEAFALFREVWALDGTLLGTIRQAEPGEAAGLQAADLLAYVLFRAEAAGGFGSLSLPEQKIFAALAKGAESILSADAGALDRMLNLHGEEMRASLRSMPERL